MFLDITKRSHFSLLCCLVRWLVSLLLEYLFWLVVTLGSTCFNMKDFVDKIWYLERFCLSLHFSILYLKHFIQTDQGMYNSKQGCPQKRLTRVNCSGQLVVKQGLHISAARRDVNNGLKWSGLALWPNLRCWGRGRKLATHSFCDTRGLECWTAVNFELTTQSDETRAVNVWWGRPADSFALRKRSQRERLFNQLFRLPDQPGLSTTSIVQGWWVQECARLPIQSPSIPPSWLPFPLLIGQFHGHALPPCSL